MRPPLTHLQSQQSSYLLVGHKSGLQKVALSLLPSVEWCSVQEMRSPAWRKGAGTQITQYNISSAICLISGLLGTAGLSASMLSCC